MQNKLAMQNKTIAELKKELKQFKDAEIYFDRLGKYDDATRLLFNEFKDKLICRIDYLMSKERQKSKRPYYTPKPNGHFEII